jgi:hypothetical protein
MALQRRRTLHPTANFVRPDKQDIPASALILAKGSLATPEPSPSAARPLISDLVTADELFLKQWMAG